MTNRRQLLRSAAMLGAAGSLAAMPQGWAGGHAQTARSQSDMTPDRALAELQAGNQRFVSGDMRNRDLMSQVKATADGQFPFAVVLGCIDSRVPPELVFDQGIGDIFSPRIAGNFANTDIIGSIEFATQLAGSRLVVVLGHTQCGAVKGACDGAELGNLTQTLSNISPALYAVTDVKGDRNSQNSEFVQRVADENVRLTVSALTDRSAVLAGLVAEKKLKVVGAMHNVSTGKVTFNT
ncbi:MAG: carbonic anhydrase family protein [Gammaproteobacteria bacterium]